MSTSRPSFRMTTLIQTATPLARRRMIRGAVLSLFAAAMAPLDRGAQILAPNGEKHYPNGDANRLPEPSDQIRMRDQQTKKYNFEVANAERKRQLSEDATQLLELAKELKIEVDKTSKDTLSLSVMRKAEIIEKLAHGVREKMKLTIGAS